MATVNLGALMGEFIQKTGSLYSSVEGTIKNKFVNLTGADAEDSKIRIVLDWFTPERQEWIAKIIFVVGVIYNFSQNKLAFVAGAGLGFFSSMGRVPAWLNFETLERGELFSMQAEQGYQVQKVMAFLAFLNWYLGDTVLDNMFFGVFSGLIAGNCTYHAAKRQIDEKMDAFLGTKVGEWTQGFYNGAASRIDSAFNSLFGNKPQDNGEF